MLVQFFTSKHYCFNYYGPPPAPLGAGVALFGVSAAHPRAALRPLPSLGQSLAFIWP